MLHRRDHVVLNLSRRHFVSSITFLLDERSLYQKSLSIWVTALVLVLGGCTTLIPPNSTTAVIDLPTKWSSADIPTSIATTRLVHWWLRFHDPLLASLITQALNANTEIRSAQAILRQARALRDVAAGGLLPAMGVSASGQHTTGNDNSSNRFVAGVDASWELDIFGVNRNAFEANKAVVKSSVANFGSVQVSIASEVAMTYIRLRGAQSQLVIANHNFLSQQETLQMTQWRQQAGLITLLEVEQARAATEQTATQLLILQISIKQSCHALAVLTGQPPAALNAVLAEVVPVPQAADNLTLRIPTETLRQRPDVRAAEFQVTAAMARVAQANAARLPNFKLSGSLGLSALALGSLTSGSSVVSAFLASVAMPVFDGGVLRAQVRSQQAALDQASIAYQAAVLTALKEVEDALIALRYDRQRLSHLQYAAAASGNASVMARQRFSSGLIDFQVVLDTQRTQFSMQDTLVRSHADVSADHVRLYKALGGGWEPDSSDMPPTITKAAQRIPSK